MDKYINSDNTHLFAYCNGELLKAPPKGVILEFTGLYCQQMHAIDEKRSSKWADDGYLHIIPYTDPWCWMNKTAFVATERLLEVLREKYHAESAPLVVCGGSMGGSSALSYTLLTLKKPLACVTNCPVCDLLYHYDEHNDIPRTMLAAFYDEGNDMFKVIGAVSPMQNADNMPKLRYVIYQCECDDDVHKPYHSDRFVPLLRNRGFDVKYVVVPNAGHCQLDEHYCRLYYADVEKGFETK